MKEYAFGIDLGGTTAKIGLFTTAGALLEKWEVPTDTSNAGEHILENLAAAIMGKMQEKAIPAEQVEGVGIGVPGPVLDSSVVPIVCANLGGWGQRNVAAQLSGLLDGLKVLVGNDANVAALGEIWMGAAKGCRSAVMVTLGTGVGGGVIVNGKVIDGSHGAGGEIGHITVNRHETATCGCGKHGCLEQYSSATGAKVQVEYTSCPPGASAAAAQSRICAPSSAHCFTSASQCCCRATGSLRNIPSPEQGASTSTRSKNSGRASAMRAGVSLSTTALGTPMRSRLLFRISARAATYSLLTSTPRPCKAAASWLLLPPGAAHRSNTRMPGCTPSSGAAEDADGSCE